jgi:protein-disulfide isomerase
VVDIYEDFQCPACASVERAFGPQVDELITSGKAEVRYHVMSFLDQNLRNDSSVRAANGGFCAHEQGKFAAWHDTLFADANRPPEEGDGWTDAQLTAFAGQTGVDMAAWGTCVQSGRTSALITAANDLSLSTGVNATPTFKLNGTQLNLNAVAAAGGLVKLVEASS